MKWLYSYICFEAYHSLIRSVLHSFIDSFIDSVTHSNIHSFVLSSHSYIPLRSVSVHFFSFISSCWWRCSLQKPRNILCKRFSASCVPLPLPCWTSASAHCKWQSPQRRHVMFWFHSLCERPKRLNTFFFIRSFIQAAIHSIHSFVPSFIQSVIHSAGDDPDVHGGNVCAHSLSTMPSVCYTGTEPKTEKKQRNTREDGN